jgi:DNA modification methylase
LKVKGAIVESCGFANSKLLKRIQMQTALLQEKLDVTKKTRANIFNWRGQFTPQLIEYLLDHYSKAGDVIADPFAGSGTVLLESIEKDVSCFGFEINPAAYAMSKFYSMSNLEQTIRAEILHSLKNKVEKLIQINCDLPIFGKGETYREQYKNLIEFTTALFAELKDKIEKVLALNMLFISEGHKTHNLGTSIHISLSQIKKFALSLPFTVRPISAHLGDARAIHLCCPSRPNLIITSPPYINVFNYHQNHRAILEAIGWNMLTVAQSEFGANRKNRGNRFKTVIQYCLDMEQSLYSFWQCLQENGLVVIVIGRESNVRSIPFYNGRMIKEIMQSMSGFEAVSDYERSFTNKFGAKIREDIIIARKTAELSRSSVGKDIAVEHLKRAVKSAAPNIKNDVLDAISNADSIIPSPLFTVREALQHA